MAIEGGFEAYVESETGETLPEVPQDSFRGSRRPPKPSQTLFDGDVWTPTDRPLFAIGKGWVLATDDALQWIVYRRQGKRWTAVRFHCEQGALLRSIKEKIEDPYPEALAKIQSWKLKTLQLKLPGRTIKIEGAFKQWLKQQKKGKRHEN